MSNPRLAPAQAPYSDAVRAALDRIMPPGVEPLALFRTLAVNERVFLRVMAGGLLDRGSISLRERELVILRTCARLGSEYEWGVHAAFFGGKAGFDAGELAATHSLARDDTPFPRRERMLVQAVDALVDSHTWSDTVFADVSREFSPEQLVEIVALVGLYHLIAFTTNAFQLAPEPYAARFAG